MNRFDIMVSQISRSGDKSRGLAYERVIGRVRPEFASLAPCVPQMPTDECKGCARHAPAAREESRFIRIDASSLKRTDGHCPMAA